MITITDQCGAGNDDRNERSTDETTLNTISRRLAAVGGESLSKVPFGVGTASPESGKGRLSFVLDHKFAVYTHVVDAAFGFEAITNFKYLHLSPPRIR